MQPQKGYFLSILQVIAGIFVLLFSFAAIVPFQFMQGAILNMKVVEGKPYLLIIAFALLFLPFSKSWKRLLFPLVAISILSIAPLSAYFEINSLPKKLKEHFKINISKKSQFSVSEYFLGAGLSQKPISYYGIFRNQKVDFNAYFTGNNSTKEPLAILIHGGGFYSGDKNYMDELGQWLAANQINAVSINYSLAPQFIYPLQCLEVIAAIEYCRKTYYKQLNSNKVILIGNSAGGTIALNTIGYLKNKQDKASIETLNAIAGVVNLYGITDVQHQLSAHQKGISDIKEMTANYFGISKDRLSNVPEIACPLLNKGFSTKPVLSIHGAKDNIVPFEHARLLHTILDQKKIPNLCIQLPWATHNLEYPISGPSGQVVRNAVEIFVKN